MKAQVTDLKVGRVGVEPTTKRLRVSHPNLENRPNTSAFPLSQSISSHLKSPAFANALRDQPSFALPDRVHPVRRPLLTLKKRQP